MAMAMLHTLASARSFQQLPAKKGAILILATG
jgi:hypothetical protein